jgi:hypothetical protein
MRALHLFDGKHADAVRVRATHEANQARRSLFDFGHPFISSFAGRCVKLVAPAALGGAPGRP